MSALTFFVCGTFVLVMVEACVRALADRGAEGRISSLEQELRDLKGGAS